MGNIYLLGFMGTGKSTVGKHLAKKLDKTFVDLDSLISDKDGREIVDIFATDGEQYFRELETAVLAEVTGRDDLVVSTGGGAAISHRNLDLMKDDGVLVTLMASPDVIWNRVKDTDQRPLLNVDDPQETIKRLLFERAYFYMKGDIVVDTSDDDIGAAVQEIMEFLEP